MIIQVFSMVGHSNMVSCCYCICLGLIANKRQKVQHIIRLNCWENQKRKRKVCRI